jgi:CheY-like chemotaxis protein
MWKDYKNVPADLVNDLHYATVEMIKMNSKILLVDDDPDDLLLLTDAFERMNRFCEVVEAYDGLAAITLLRQMKSKDERPNLIVIDINMPVMDGRELLSLVKKEAYWKDLPIVMLSTSNNFFDKQFCTQYDVELITKPNTTQQINNLVKELLSMSTQLQKAG